MPPSQPTAATPSLSPDRLWAEQLAIGLALLVGLLIFMAIFHAPTLSTGAQIFGPNYVDAYGWASFLVIVLQVVLHEVGTLVAAWWMGVPLRFRFFFFGAHATAMLEEQPRRPWVDAFVGFAGPITGSFVSLLLAGIYLYTRYEDTSMDVGNPFFLGMACIGYFYNLFTLIPILDLEGGWIAPVIAPQAWLFGLVGVGLELTHGFNLVLLGVFAFGLPRLILLIGARAPRLDLACTHRQRIVVNLSYFALVIMLAWLGTTTFEELGRLIPEAMGD